ncbi:MAG: 50S ribosomal protein L29 [Cryomorphaceae bacterium BACL7 MAG-120910-bin2]|jgi:large subunit ribosomal protein L29|nr:MAG: 50S ribosomal protein L29 [Cryomorphaceae bacterium BACL7 MAG-120910-bin2]KRO69479.1 MAG: 50S ribosomal protein L29 [Cryomorphaceae bacterium BACL7 MAG-120322-bin74]KRO82559.1 MAG: 50S ribosomal protein L29 [Cryomorphaceae bacterium BACL7 MAG-121220-bin83]NQW25132.1 50S ribosomal protein L29 [Cryomorphaceae bacterium]|tara:strand:+ start:518 stop:709 length:192 start_codon:yes stop_codon:yes gene_type:complete
MKMKEIQNLSQEELMNQLSSVKKELSEMQRKHRISPMDNPMVIKAMRKVVARLSTEVTNRQVK